jgi:hypothetical protein
MTQLFIDGKQAVIPEDFNVTVYYENAYFTKSSTYSLDVELPMPENRHIFGMMSRMDKTKKQATYSAILIADGIRLVYGSAIVTGVTDTSVKVQLMSGNSEFNYILDDESYIDEVSWDYVEGDKSPFNGQCQILNVQVEDEFEMSMIKTVSGWVKNGDYRVSVGGFCLPYLTEIIKRIIRYKGYKVGYNLFDECWMKNILVIGGFKSSRCRSYDYKNQYSSAFYMPHWTYSELFSNIEDFAGVVVSVNDRQRTVSLIPLNEYFSTDILSIEEVVDEYEVEVDTESSEEKNSTINNIKYDFPSNAVDNYDRLSDDIRFNATRYEASSYEEAKAKWTKDNKANKVKTLYTAENRYYINKEEDNSNEFKEVDIYGDLIRDEESDNYTSLKIAPVKIEQINVGLYSEPDTRGNCHKVEDLEMNIPVTRYDSKKIKQDIDNIQTFIDENRSLEEESNKDIMEIALVEETKIKCGSYGEIPLVSTFIDCEQKVDEQSQGFSPFSLSLKNVCEQSIGRIQAELDKIESNITYKISFRYKKIPEINKTFLIHNQKYVAKKLEIKVTAKGWNRIIDGEFYKINT